MKKFSNYIQNNDKAVALSYHEKNSAPHIAAKGTGLSANNIIELAEANDIPIQKDESLVSLLMGLEVDEKIPENLYQVVAEIFAFIYKLDQQYSEKE
jgi:flagellar biosynthesis protein